MRDSRAARPPARSEGCPLGAPAPAVSFRRRCYTCTNFDYNRFYLTPSADLLARLLPGSPGPGAREAADRAVLLTLGEHHAEVG